jgi:hypothetical protein
MVAQVAWQNDLAEYKIQRSITFLPIEIQLLSIHHWVSLENTFHLVYYMMKNIEYKKLACYPYIKKCPSTYSILGTKTLPEEPGPTVINFLTNCAIS